MNNRFRFLVGFTIIAIFLLACAISAVAPPAFAAKPANPTAWIATWGGKWTNLRQVRFIVQKVEGGKAEVVYEWEASPLDRVPDRGKREWVLEFIDENTLVKASGSTPLKFTLSPDASEIRLTEVNNPTHFAVLKKK